MKLLEAKITDVKMRHQNFQLTTSKPNQASKFEGGNFAKSWIQAVAFANCKLGVVPT